jgi:L-ribulose-5-phosphate 3-epimerase
MGVSGHRKFPLGSSSGAARDRAVDILYRAIDLASDIGVKIIQVMGYDVFYETSNDETQSRYLDGLKLGAKRAGTAGVMLGVENVDVEFSESIEKVMQIVHAVGSPWLNIYPDMGNLAAARYNPVSQLRFGEGHIVALHIKDATPGNYRGVVFEKGDVPFRSVFQAISDIGFFGPMVVEMWAQLQTDGDSLDHAVKARKMVDQLISDTWI